MIVASGVEIGAALPQCISIGERSVLLTRIAATKSVSLCAPMKADGLSGTGKGNTQVHGEFDLVMAALHRM